jgi:hypothetical protein
MEWYKYGEVVKRATLFKYIHTYVCMYAQIDIDARLLIPGTVQHRSMQRICILPFSFCAIIRSCIYWASPVA